MSSYPPDLVCWLLNSVQRLNATSSTVYIGLRGQKAATAYCLAKQSCLEADRTEVIVNHLPPQGPLLLTSQASATSGAAGLAGEVIVTDMIQTHRPSILEAGPALYKCYANVLYLLFYHRT